MRVRPPIYSWNGKLGTPKALQLDHDAARAQFVRASTEGGKIASIARRLALLCLPHFEREERLAFPALGLLPLLVRGRVRPRMARFLPLIADFGAHRSELDEHHQSIEHVIDALLDACRRDRNREIAQFARDLRVHERIEDDVIYPTVIMIGDYLRERLPQR